MRIMVLIASLCWAGGESLPIESFDKPGAVQAVQQALDDKFSIRGGTVSATAVFLSSMTVNGVANFVFWLGMPQYSSTALISLAAPDSGYQVYNTTRKAVCVSTGTGTGAWIHMTTMTVAGTFVDCAD